MITKPKPTTELAEEVDAARQAWAAEAVRLCNEKRIAGIDATADERRLARQWITSFMFKPECELGRVDSSGPPKISE